jgi:hypothetical protein
MQTFAYFFILLTPVKDVCLHTCCFIEIIFCFIEINFYLIEINFYLIEIAMQFYM